MKAKDQFMNLGVFHVNNGKDIRFWEDRWLGNFTLQQRFPSLYNIVRRRNATVASVFSSTPLNISFRRGLYNDNLNRWHELVALVAHTQLNDTGDKFWWSLHQNKMFLVRSMYEHLVCDGLVRQDKLIWKLKLPLKIKIFFWYIKKGVVLTKDNLARRNWKGSKKYVFCAHDESIQRLFFDCHYAKFLWCAIHFTFGINVPASINHMCLGWLSGVDARHKSKILVGAIAICWSLWLNRNYIVFDKGICKTYMQVLFRGTYWCRFWALLQKREEDATMMKTACRALETTVMQLFITHGWRFSNRITF